MYKEEIVYYVIKWQGYKIRMVLIVSSSCPVLLYWGEGRKGTAIEMHFERREQSVPTRNWNNEMKMHFRPHTKLARVLIVSI